MSAARSLYTFAFPEFAMRRLALLLLFALVACGYKGPLYMPPPNQAPPPAPAPDAPADRR